MSVNHSIEIASHYLGTEVLRTTSFGAVLPFPTSDNGKLFLEDLYMPQLYARVFLQILDSSLAEDYQTRHIFEDLLKLTNQDGVVDMTRQAIARRTNVPLEIINKAVDKLESSDTGSRDKEHDGRRIIRLDEHRDWGWRILNFQKYEAIRVNNDMREWNATRMANYRAKKKGPSALPKESTLTPSPSPEGSPTSSTTCSTTNPNPPIVPQGTFGLEIEPTVHPANGKEWHPTEYQKFFNVLFKRRDTTRWSDKEIKAFNSLDPQEEDFKPLHTYYTANIPESKDIRRRDLYTFLNNYTSEVDRAYRFKPYRQF